MTLFWSSSGFRSEAAPSVVILASGRDAGDRRSRGASAYLYLHAVPGGSAASGGSIVA